MFNEFLDLPSPYLFHVYSNPHKFMNIFLSIWEILIGHTQSFLFFFCICYCNKYASSSIFYPYVIILVFLSLWTFVHLTHLPKNILFFLKWKVIFNNFLFI